MLGRRGNDSLQEMEQQEGKFAALHREFWALEEDRMMMISSLEFEYGKKVSTVTPGSSVSQARFFLPHSGFRE